MFFSSRDIFYPWSIPPVSDIPREEIEPLVLYNNLHGLIALLNKYPNPNDQAYALYMAVYHGNKEFIGYLVNFCGVPITIDNNGPLSAAILSKNATTVRYLLSLGADVNFGHGMAMDMAITMSDGNCEMVYLLLEYGVNVHMDNDRPLRYAVRQGKIELVDVILKHGGNIYVEGTIGTIEGRDGKAIFTEVVYKWKIDFMMAMLRRGMEVLHPECEEALVMAVKLGKRDFIAFLVNVCGADVRYRNNEALRWAVKRKLFDEVLYILENGGGYGSGGE